MNLTAVGKSIKCVLNSGVEFHLQGSSFRVRFSGQLVSSIGIYIEICYLCLRESGRTLSLRSGGGINLHHNSPSAAGLS